MRVMISQPIVGTVEEQARIRAKVIAKLEAEGHEVWGELPQRVPTPNGVNEELWQLGCRLQDMATADAVYFMDGWVYDKQCRTEYNVAISYELITLNQYKSKKTILYKIIIYSIYFVSYWTKNKDNIYSILFFILSISFFLQATYLAFK